MLGYALQFETWNRNIRTESIWAPVDNISDIHKSYSVVHKQFSLGLGWPKVAFKKNCVKFRQRWPHLTDGLNKAKLFRLP